MNGVTLMDEKSPGRWWRAEPRATDLWWQTRTKRSNRRLEGLNLSSRYFLKRSKIDISQKFEEFWTADETQIPSDPFNPRNPRLPFSRTKIAKARRATRTPSNGLETAKTSQPEWWAVRVRSPCSLCVAACMELNQLQRRTPSSAIEPLRSLKIAGEAFMTLINKRPKCLRQVGCWNWSGIDATPRPQSQTRPLR
jgi:hypothetical protein